MPNQTDDHPNDPDLPDGLVPYPALSFAAVKWLNQRSGGPTGAYPDLPKVLTPLFYDQIDKSKPVAVLRTHREETTAQLLRPFGTSGGIAEPDEVLDFIARMDPNETLVQTTTVEPCRRSAPGNCSASGRPTRDQSAETPKTCNRSRAVNPMPATPTTRVEPRHT